MSRACLREQVSGKLKEVRAPEHWSAGGKGTRGVKKLLPSSLQATFFEQLQASALEVAPTSLNDSCCGLELISLRKRWECPGLSLLASNFERWLLSSSDREGQSTVGHEDGDPESYPPGLS
ncbi:hypothetical protein P7K49_020541 [Saguinus oedipus]|uniref:Uncharacterized protein n=1 Tax=Saguinus oedipus TaxID=9490 RepID=A0ABQ9V0K4_SAGOE|nr:hypothetical protein P7K49_020541 [Saguinus oedipus]